MTAKPPLTYQVRMDGACESSAARVNAFSAGAAAEQWAAVWCRRDPGAFALFEDGVAVLVEGAGQVRRLKVFGCVVPSFAACDTSDEGGPQP